MQRPARAWAAVFTLFCCKTIAAGLLSIAAAEIGNTCSVRADGPAEQFALPLTQQFGVTAVNEYSGLVEVTLSGTGGTNPGETIDAFYMFEQPPGAPVAPFAHNGVRISRGTCACAPGEGAGREDCNSPHIAEFIVYIGGVGVVGSGTKPSYDPDHEYRFIIDLGELAAPVTLGIHDCGVFDNRGTFLVELRAVSDLPTPTPPPTPTDTPTPPPPTPTPSGTPTATPTLKPVGQPCAGAGECDNGVCADGVCCDRACDAVNEFCALPGFEGTCIAVALPTATVTSTSTPNPTPQLNGIRCVFDIECVSGFCTHGFCCAERCDRSDQVCAVPGFEGQCLAVLGSPTATPSGTSSTTPTATVSGTPTDTPTQSPTQTLPPTATATSTPPHTATASHSPTVTPTFSPTINPTFAACVGNCNLDDQVTVNELIQGVNIVLGVLPPSACLAFDADRNGVVVVNELVRAVANALLGCGVEPATPRLTSTRTRTPTAVFTATRTPTATPTRTRTPTLRPTAAPTATATTPEGGDACPWAFTQRVANAADTCVFVGEFNDQCGGTAFAGWLSTGTAVVAIVAFAGDLTAVFGGEVVDGDYATLVLWDTDTNLTNPRPVNGGMAMVNGRTGFGIVPFSSPFSVNGCPFDFFAGLYSGLLGEGAGQGAPAMAMTPAVDLARLLEAVKKKVNR